MRWWKEKFDLSAGRGSRGRLLRALVRSERGERVAAARRLIAEPLSPEEVAALCPFLEDLLRPPEGEDARPGVQPGERAPESELARQVIEALGLARWRRAIPTLLHLFRHTPGEDPLREALRRALERIQPGLTDPNAQAPDASAELQPRTVMKGGLLARNGLPALRDFLERMPLCGVFATVEMPWTAYEETLRVDRSRLGDRRLRREPDFSGTLDEIVRQVIDALYATSADLGKKVREAGRSVIQPHTGEGVPGLAEVKTQFGSAFAYLDLVARCDRDWFYYWGTERER